MKLVDDQLWLSPTDLGSFAACEHLAQLELAAALGEIEKPHYADAYGDLIKQKGDEHESAFLDSLRAAGREVVEIGLGEDRDFVATARRTEEAMRSGAEFVYQAVLVHDGWRGLADFLERVDEPSDLGAFSYQVLDTKLARHPRPEHALQLCFYSEAVGYTQGRVPENAYVVLGTSERASIRLADVSAYYRRLRGRFRNALDTRPETEAYPCDHCSICDFKPVCADGWHQQDHLLLVAGIRRDQVERLYTAGIATRGELAAAPVGLAIPKIASDTYARLRDQASAQVESDQSATLVSHPRPPEPERGFHLLPQPSPGDVVLDLEGHPFFEPARGLEFLFGVVLVEADGPRYVPFWAHGRDAEKHAFEHVVDLVHERLERHPDMHLYHYGAYESGALKRLMGEYGTREDEIDDLLRRRVLVDLLTVTRQALVVGAESYSLKETEKLAGFERHADVGSGSEAVVDYERWLHADDPGLLDAIAAYNEEDCRATLALRDWLLSERPELPWREPIPRKRHADETQEEIDAREALRRALVDGNDDGSSRRLAGELLEYHRREARPGWWWFFERCALEPDGLVDDVESIGGLEPVSGAEPEPLAKSLVWTLRYPEQDTKLESGDSVCDPATLEDAGELLTVDADGGVVRLKRGPKLSTVPLPRALVPGGPYRDPQQRAAVMRVCESIRDGSERYPAIEGLIARDLPRLIGRSPGQPIQTIDIDEQKRLAQALDGSHLFVQGPPGSGKTWTGARLVVDLIRGGKRVGITSQSHKAIHNLLDEIERVAHDEGVEFRGLKKAADGNDESVYEGDFIASASSTRDFDDLDDDIALVAGTSWLFSRPALDNVVDTLVVDEAGQIALANAVAVATAARNLVLLGDPLQLAQVSQGTHPGGSGASVLEHLLAGAPTIPAERGIFLEESWRMHPDVCRFISEIVYAGRLGSAEEAARRSTALGTGIRFLPVEHEGNRTVSDEEVARIARELEAVIDSTFTEPDGSMRPLAAADVMVVAPYNAQVRRLRAGLPVGVRVGTVDKFQGQEAPVVFFSMATSSGEDVPRNLAFLFSRNRLNVAISRAQCLALLVCSPRLLEARCRTIEEMQLVNALCRLVEVAEAQAAL